MRQSTGKPVESQTTWEYSYPDEAGVGGGRKWPSVAEMPRYLIMAVRSRAQ